MNLAQRLNLIFGPSSKPSETEWRKLDLELNRKEADLGFSRPSLATNDY